MMEANDAPYSRLTKEQQQSNTCSEDRAYSHLTKAQQQPNTQHRATKLELYLHMSKERGPWKGCSERAADSFLLASNARAQRAIEIIRINQRSQTEHRSAHDTIAVLIVKHTRTQVDDHVAMQD